MESLEPFLGALLDRRELMSWRYERQQALKKIVDSCRDLLGVDEVEIRYSWSAQNHAKMFSMLLDILHEKQGDLRLPLGTWKHLKLVLTNDDMDIDDATSDLDTDHTSIGPTVPSIWGSP